jgi:hypothetical protein
MIKYENGEKDLFDRTPKPSTRNANASPARTSVAPNQNRTQQASRVQSQSVRQAEVEVEPEPVVHHRRGYIGLGVGGSFLTETYDNANAGVQVNLNFGYLFSQHIGMNVSVFATSYELSNYNDKSVGLTGFLAGPLFSMAPQSGKINFDIRPTIGYAFGDVTVGSNSGSTDEGTFAAGIGGSVRWNCGRSISLSVNTDYYHGVINKADLSSLGITFGFNIRLK